jgi:phage shock protein E
LVNGKKVLLMNSLKELVKNPSTILVDVRNPWEYEMEHIPGSKNIPLEDVLYKAEELKALNSPVVFFCRSGNRSGMAVNVLKQNGVTQVYNGGSLDDIQVLLN